MRQIFTYPLKDDEKHTVEKAKKEMCQCASEMGFISQPERFDVKMYRDEKGIIQYRLDATFNT